MDQTFYCDMNIPDGTDLKKLPAIIQYILAASYLNQAIGSWAYEKAIKEHPEYFVDELIARSKWALVPQLDKDAYCHELSERTVKLYADCGDSGGVFEWANNTPKSIDFNECIKGKEGEYKIIQREVHDKYLSVYDIDFTQ